jgi:hypothetical protein
VAATERRRVDAREQLRTALEMFASMGAEAFAGRAERELVTTGEHVRERSVPGTSSPPRRLRSLGPRARACRTPRSEHNYSSAQHTVAHYLRKVFSKLDITSRNQLARVLAESADLVPMA